MRHSVRTVTSRITIRDAAVSERGLGYPCLRTSDLLVLTRNVSHSNKRALAGEPVPLVPEGLKPSPHPPLP